MLSYCTFDLPNQLAQLLRHINPLALAQRTLHLGRELNQPLAKHVHFALCFLKLFPRVRHLVLLLEPRRASFSQRPLNDTTCRFPASIKHIADENGGHATTLTCDPSQDTVVPHDPKSLAICSAYFFVS
jgi:hypothetical protein